MNRRNFIMGIGGILIASQAPAIVRASSLMPIKSYAMRTWMIEMVTHDGGENWHCAAVEKYDHHAHRGPVRLNAPLAAGSFSVTMNRGKDGASVPLKKWIYLREDAKVCDAIQKAGINPLRCYVT